MSGTPTNPYIYYILGSDGSNFKIVSKSGGTLTDRLEISSVGNMTFNGNLNATSYIVGGTNILTITSNYTASTSNILVDAIKNNKSSQWTTSNNNIYYNTSNVGIGTVNPLEKLHIYDDINNKTKLVIQNKYVLNNTSNITSSPSAITTGITGNYIYQVFTYTTETAGIGTGQSLYTLNVPTGGVTCDILLVGGGGGGGGGHGGGGGAGQLVLIKDAVLNGNYTMRVGKGGVRGTNPATGGVEPTKGSNSLFDYVIAEGGGANGGNTLKDGGSGAGGDSWLNGLGVKGKGLKNTTIDTYSSGTVYSRGNDGGEGGTDPGQGAGGGGAGTSGGNGANSYTNGGPGNGGDGLSGISEIGYDFKTNFGTNVGKLELDNLIYFAGGGGGGGWSQPVVATGGKGGGGDGGSGANNGVDSGKDAIHNTGSGGGGGSGNYGLGGNGGSGIIILRYLSPSTSSSLELVRGTTIDGAVDYSVGNYDSDFKVISSVSGTSTDKLIISSNGNLTFNGSINATSYLLNGSPFSLQDTSNYVVSTSNILIPRIQSEVTSASNILVSKVNLNDTNSSNYVARISTDVNSRVWTTSQIPNLATSNIINLDTALSGKQGTINSVANQIIMGMKQN